MEASHTDRLKLIDDGTCLLIMSAILFQASGVTLIFFMAGNMVALKSNRPVYCDHVPYDAHLDWN